MDPVSFIIQNIEQGVPDSEIISQMQAAGLDDQTILEAFSQAYLELDLAATDGVLEQLARTKPAQPPKPVSEADIKRTKLIGVGVILFGLALIVLVLSAVIGLGLGSGGNSTSNTGVLDIPKIPSSFEANSPRLNPNQSTSEAQVTDVSPADTSDLQVSVELEQDYDRSQFSYQTVCARVRELISEQFLVSCLDNENWYKYTYTENNQRYCTDSSGNVAVSYNQPTTDRQNCIGESFDSSSLEEMIVQSVEQSGSHERNDPRYRALEFTRPQIEFSGPDWMSREALCFGRLLTIDWYASLGISDIILGIYQPGFGNETVKTIGAFPATNNPDRIPGFGTTIWNVGVLRDDEVLRPGSGYRFVIQDADGAVRTESNSFSIAQCQ